MSSDSDDKALVAASTTRRTDHNPKVARGCDERERACLRPWLPARSAVVEVAEHPLHVLCVGDHLRQRTELDELGVFVVGVDVAGRAVERFSRSNALLRSSSVVE